MTSVLKRDYGNRARYLASQNYERLHIYATTTALMADVSTATGRVAYVVANDTVYIGQGGTWLPFPSGLGNGLVPLGNWNASTNTPTVTSGVGSTGQFYKVSVAGSTTIDGNSTWAVGDLMLFDGTTWDRILGPNGSGGGGSSGQFLSSVADSGAAALSAGNYTLGSKFMPLTAMSCKGIQLWWMGAATSLDITLWNHAEASIATGSLSVTSTPGLFTLLFGSPVVLTPGLFYTISYSDTAGSPQYASVANTLLPVNAFSPPGYLVATAVAVAGTNTFPSSPSTPGGYLCDPLFS